MAWEARLARLWASLDELGESAFVERMEQLVAELPADSAVAAFERAAALDSTGHSDLAVPLYRQALARGLPGNRRRRAVIQLASSLRNLGRPNESVDLLSAERAQGADELDDAVSAFLALGLVDTGRTREAVAVALTALSGHLVRYRRSLVNYAALLADTPAAALTATNPAASGAAAVLYASDLARLRKFYADVAGMTLVRAAADHVVLATAVFQLVVVAIPEDVAATIVVASPPVRREETPIKLVFCVASLAAARAAAARLGGALDAVDREWHHDGFRICDGHDPEGNVVQWREPAA